MSKDEKSDYFINTHTGNRTSKLIAKKKPDGTYETEPEIKARLSGSWNVNDVECTYDENGNCITSPAHSSKNARRNRKSKERRRNKKKNSTVDEDAPVSEDDATAEPMDAELTEESEKLEDQDDGMDDIPNVPDQESEPVVDEEPAEASDLEKLDAHTEALAEDKLMSMTHAELKDLAKRAGEKVSGTKAELIARLRGDEDQA